MAISFIFQKRLSELVDDSDYTRTELRELLHVGCTSFTNAVVYGIVPTPRTLIKFADFFEVSLNYLLGKTDSNDYSPSITPTTFHERFTKLCQEKSVSRYRVAFDCGLPDSIITRWFSKGFTPSLDTLELLCDYFEVSPDYLLGRSDFKD